MCTLLGTSTNLVVASRYREDYGVPLGLFSSARFGLAAVFVGIAYMAFASQFECLLPSRSPISEAAAIKSSRPSITNFKQGTALRPNKDGTPQVDTKRVVFVVCVLLAVIILAATDVLPIAVGVLFASARPNPLALGGTHS